ncbi:hypothetical protein RCO48_21165 [Peribacillus frigoritolerans]|nr:hypothetical protein [Peribacillus frigoritolerans]
MVGAFNPEMVLNLPASGFHRVGKNPKRKLLWRCTAIPGFF